MNGKGSSPITLNPEGFSTKPFVEVIDPMLCSKSTSPTSRGCTTDVAPKENQSR